MYIETHAHLNFSNFSDDLEQVIERAKNVGVEKIINVGIDIQTSRQSIQLAEKYDIIYATAGIHPHDSEKIVPEHWIQLENLLAHPKVVALGEIGLDYYRDYAQRNIQREVLIRQLKLAVTTKMPVVVHTRSAWPDIIDIFEGEFKNKLSGVFHCFSGDEEIARKVIDWGFYISFTGVVTFKNAAALGIAQNVPNDRIMVETDCPFMAPSPFRGTRSEPSHIPLIADKIAEAKGSKLKEFAKQTSDNAKSLFRFESTH